VPLRKELRRSKSFRSIEGGEGGVKLGGSGEGKWVAIGIGNDCGGGA